MCTTASCCDRGWKESLPDGCPAGVEPTDPTGETLYRLIAGAQPALADFRSHQDLDPQKHFLFGSPCEARSVSLWTTVEQCRALQKRPNHRQKRIASVVVEANAGVVKRKNTGHVSWWLCAGADPLARAAVVE